MEQWVNKFIAFFAISSGQEETAENAGSAEICRKLKFKLMYVFTTKPTCPVAAPEP